MAHSLLTQIVLPVVVSLICGVFLTLYAKPLTNWKETRDKFQAENKAARFRREEKRAILLAKDPIEYLTSLVDQGFNVLLALGCVILGMILISFPFIISIPRPGWYPFGGLIDKSFVVVLFIIGGLLMGMGIAIIFGAVREGKRIVAAIKRIQIKSEMGLLSSTGSLERAQDVAHDKAGDTPERPS